MTPFLLAALLIPACTPTAAGAGAPPPALGSDERSAIVEHLTTLFPPLPVDDEGHSGNGAWYDPRRTKLTPINDPLLQRAAPGTHFFQTEITTNYNEFRFIPTLVSARKTSGSYDIRTFRSTLWTGKPDGGFLDQFVGLEAATEEERTDLASALGRLIARTIAEGKIRPEPADGNTHTVQISWIGQPYRDLQMTCHGTGKVTGVSLFLTQKDMLALLIAETGKVSPRLEGLSPGDGSARVKEILEPWFERLRPFRTRWPRGTRGPRDKGKVGGVCLEVLQEWIRVTGPKAVLDAVRDEHPSLAVALGWLEDPSRRRDFLYRIVLRLTGTPGGSDLGVLVAVVRWEALLLQGRAAGEEQLDSLTSDLILLFTERSPDGISRSGAGYYSKGRLKDGGFKKSLRDGSDQVRHFAWAFRHFAASDNREATEELLHAKEIRDALERDQEVSEADLALNRAARQIVEEILPGTGKPPGGAPERTRPDPAPIEDYPGLLKRRLAGAGAGGARQVI